MRPAPRSCAWRSGYRSIPRPRARCAIGTPRSVNSTPRSTRFRPRRTHTQTDERVHTIIMVQDPYLPRPEHKFSFGLWTVGNPGRDPFGLPVRELLPPNDLV